MRPAHPGSPGLPPGRPHNAPPHCIKELAPMSSGGFHVHGPHDHELEHAAQGEHGQTAHHGIGGGSLTNQIAMCTAVIATVGAIRSEEHTSELQSQSNLVCRLLLEKKKKKTQNKSHK